LIRGWAPVRAKKRVKASGEQILFDHRTRLRAPLFAEALGV
jgi:hypothetical protein